MPNLVHLADVKEIVSIRKNGIKISKWRTGIYCMPVLPHFYLSHQWLRELKRNGTRTICAVYFNLSSNEMVFAGRYNEEHQHIPLSEAITNFYNADEKDKLGYELIIPRKILSGEISSIKMLPQNVGWRIHPESKGQKPFCTVPDCPCNQGQINRKRFVKTSQTTRETFSDE